ncbi:MAG: hypothetical protein FRX49_11033 [Trebouxia sp. A1-2]|nr:MAG: hypothetical protein FRX49_11033 [Trebouxia sp. A1-2]
MEGEAGVTADQNFGTPRSVGWSMLVLEEEGGAVGGGAQHRSQQCPQSCQLYSDSACLTGVPFKGLRYLIYGETSSGCYVGHYGIYLSALLLRHAAARRLCNTNQQSGLAGPQQGLHESKGTGVKGRKGSKQHQIGRC